MNMCHFSADRFIYVREDVKEWGVERQCDALCYLCWHGVFSCASVSFPVSELCTHCPHNERNVVSRCLPAPASSHTQYVIIGFLYIHATRVLLYFPLRTKMEITRVREISGTIKCAVKNDLQISESRFVCLIQQSVSWQGESRSLVHKFPDFYKTWKLTAIQINQPTRCNSFTSLLLDVYVWLNMFRAPLRPSSGAYNCTRSLWFYRWSVAVGALQPPRSNGKTRGY